MALRFVGYVTFQKCYVVKIKTINTAHQDSHCVSSYAHNICTFYNANFRTASIYYNISVTNVKKIIIMVAQSLFVPLRLCKNPFFLLPNPITHFNFKWPLEVAQFVANLVSRRFYMLAFAKPYV